MHYTVGRNGQVVIAKEIREQLGAKPGWIALQRVVDGHVEIHFVPPEHNRSLAGSLVAYVTREITPDDDWSQVREQAWNAAAADEVSGWDDGL